MKHPRRGSGRLRVLTAGAACALFSAALLVSPAAADPVADTLQPLESATSENGSRITRIEKDSDRELRVYVHSASMDREIQLDVTRPADTSEPRPTLYLLNGAGGGEDAATWRLRTDAQDFFADKNLNIVTPVGGKWSYYTDWKQEDPVLGLHKWETFLTKEIPPLIDAALGTNGVNAIAGLSSSGTSVLQLAIAGGGLYKGVAAYSGCAQTSDPIGHEFIRITTEVWGGADDVRNMWGEPDDPTWVEKDPYVNAEKLRGIDLYVSSATGLPGKHEHLGARSVGNDPALLLNQVVMGGVIEAAVDDCTRRLAARLEELDIPAVFEFRPTGTHSWGYWEDDLHNSWPMLARAMETR